MRNYASFAIGELFCWRRLRLFTFFTDGTKRVCCPEQPRRSAEAAPCAVHRRIGNPQHAITEARGGEMLHFQDPRNGLPPGPFIEQLGSEVYHRAAPDRKPTTARKPTWPPFGLCEDRSEPEGPRCWRTGCSSTPNVQPRAHFMRPTFRLPNINCEKCTRRSSFGWVRHALNRDGDYSYHHCANVKITATPRCQSIPLGQENPAQVECIGLASPSCSGCVGRMSAMRLRPLRGRFADT